MTEHQHKSLQIGLTFWPITDYQKYNEAARIANAAVEDFLYRKP